MAAAGPALRHGGALPKGSARWRMVKRRCLCRSVRAEPLQWLAGAFPARHSSSAIGRPVDGVEEAFAEAELKLDAKAKRRQQEKTERLAAT